MARNLAALLAGLVAGIVVAFVVVVPIAVALIVGSDIAVGSKADLQNPGHVWAVFIALPSHMKLLIILVWFMGPLVGGLVAKRIGSAVWPLWGIVALFAVDAVRTVLSLPLPIWVQAVWVAAPFLGGLLALRLGASRRAAADGIQAG